MPARIHTLIDRLNLQPHPEGGYFAEVYRSPEQVQPADDRTARAALTTIYFLLAAGQHSRWHRVASAEVWHYYEGEPLELLWLSADLRTCHTKRLGPLDASTAPVQIVPAGCWQAAHPLGAYTLVGCTVGPGFDFADFQMAHTHPDADAIRTRFPEQAVFL